MLPLKYEWDALCKRVVRKEQTDVPVVQVLLGNESSMRDAIDYRGESVLAHTRYIEEQDWALVGKIDMDEIESIITDIGEAMIVVCLIAIAASLLLAILLAQRIVFPIEKLKKNMSGCPPLTTR